MQEAAERLSAETSGANWTYNNPATKVVARLIAKYEQPPVDPDVEAFKRVLAMGGLYAYTPPMLAQFKKEIAAAKERG